MEWKYNSYQLFKDAPIKKVQKERQIVIINNTLTLLYTMQQNNFHHELLFYNYRFKNTFKPVLKGHL